MDIQIVLTPAGFRITPAHRRISGSGRVAEVAARRIPGPRERDGAGTAGLAGERLRPHHRGVGAQALRCLAGGHSGVGENDGRAT